MGVVDCQTPSLLDSLEFNVAPQTPQARRAAAMRGLPAARAEFVRSVSINVDDFRVGARFMEGLLNRARRSKSPGGLWILGHGGQGKSFLLDAFSRRHPPVDTTKWRQCEVMLIPLRSRPSKSDILLTIMLILGINPDMLKYQNNSDLEKIVVDAMAHCGVRVILFDESQHLWLSTTGKINRSADRLGGEVGDFLKELYDKTGIAFVFAGTPGLEVVVNSDSQANTRWAGVLHLKPFENDAKFSALLEALDDSLPMEERSNLAEPELLSMIHQATQGNFRRLKNLLAEAVFLAASAEERRVRKQHLADAFFEISCAEATPFGHAS